MTTPSKFDLPQGTLDLLILRVVALGPIHGYAIAQHIQMISKEALQIQQGSAHCIPRSTGWNRRIFSSPNGVRPKPAARQNFIS
jgi:hypothetical protein